MYGKLHVFVIGGGAGPNSIDVVPELSPGGVDLRGRESLRDDYKTLGVQVVLPPFVLVREAVGHLELDSRIVVKS